MTMKNSNAEKFVIEIVNYVFSPLVEEIFCYLPKAVFKGIR